MVPHKPEKLLTERKDGKDLPEELMEAIIARLPITALMRSRLVCHNWKSLIGSPSFKSECQNLSCLFTTYTCKIITRCRPYEEMKGALFDPLMKKWHYDFPIPSFTAFSSVCSAGGFVCYADYNRSTFHVGNPLTQTWKPLPSSETFFTNLRGLDSCFAVGIVSLDHARGYQIVWVDSGGLYEVYDSLTRPTCIGRVPDNISCRSLLVSCGSVTIGTIVYFLCRDPDGILSYDVESEAWEQLQLQFLPCSTLAKQVFFGLAECGGQLLLVVFEQNTDPAGVSLSVWELQREVMVWAEVDRMPNSLGSEFTDEYVFLRCVGSKRLLVMSLHAVTKNRIFMYDVVSHEWSELPPCGRQTIVSGVGFFPSLLASP